MYNYYEFAEKILYKLFRLCIKQHVFIVELRHIVGMFTDDDGNILSIEKEMEMFYRVAENFKKEYPLFKFNLILCGLKVIGKEHMDK